MIYSKLSLDTIKKNSRAYLPFIISNIVTTAMLYIMGSLAENPGLRNIRGGSGVSSMLGSGNIILYIFCAVFMIYTNSAISKQRRKEFGLYSILGMEKRHIARVIFYENIFVMLISLLLGLGIGLIFDKLAFMTVMNVLDEKASLGFYISPSSLLFTSLFMIGAFALLTIISIIRVRISNPMELLKSSNTGEREPKARWIIAVLGIICLGCGYYISLTTTNVREGIDSFFIAVLLVIAGTYLLFMAGTVAFLKLLKKSKKYYYKTKHFISVSALMYRMKQNALGLASICILSTMVLVMMSSTISLLAGLNDNVESHHPYDINISTDDPELFDTFDAYLAENGYKTCNQLKFEAISFCVSYDGGSAFVPYEEQYGGDFGIYLIPCEAYNRLTGSDFTLGNHEVLYFTDEDIDLDRFSVLGEEFTVKKKIDEFGYETEYYEKMVKVIVDSTETLHKVSDLQQQAYEFSTSTGKNYFFDLAPEEETDPNVICRNFLPYIADKNSQDENNVYFSYLYSTKLDLKQDHLETYGGLFFIGVFLGSIFLMQTILIIYYKQITEGYDDKKRFEIMQNVGMDKGEVRSSIRSQVLTVFFMPLITAGIHIAFAFPIISRMLKLVGLYNTSLFAWTTLLTFLAFAAVYGMIYLLTARIYYKIVKR